MVGANRSFGSLLYTVAHLFVQLRYNIWQLMNFANALSCIALDQECVLPQYDLQKFVVLSNAAHDLKRRACQTIIILPKPLLQSLLEN